MQVVHFGRFVFTGAGQDGEGSAVVIQLIRDVQCRLGFLFGGGRDGGGLPEARGRTCAGEKDGQKGDCREKCRASASSVAASQVLYG